MPAITFVLVRRFWVCKKVLKDKVLMLPLHNRDGNFTASLPCRAGVEKIFATLIALQFTLDWIFIHFDRKLLFLLRSVCQ